ncbi:MAG TPA: feruloyl-CoA synthase [Burkholderiales bacterium]|nr:feruloyl-CoA synthase [Burkholderiales bacterium]
MREQSRPIRKVALGPRDVEVERRAGGILHLRSPHRLRPFPDRITERLEYWAKAAPERVLFAQRDGSGWRTVSYAQARHRARRVGQYLLQKQLSAQRPLVVLSGNDIEHALLHLGAMYVGVPYAPISPAYSLLSTDFGKLRAILELLTPGLVFVSDRESFRRALEAVVRCPVITELEEPAATRAVDEAHARVGPDTIVKFLFTSGSTGTPKAVINTQRMWCANQQMILSMLPFFGEEPPVLVDWAPWHHTAAGNHDLGLVLYNGGSYYIDEGKPMPGAIEATVRNLREIAPTWYFNVPKGFEALLPFLRKDALLRKNFFSRLQVLWFAGAALPQHVFDEMKQLAFDARGEEIAFLTGFGATETAPATLGRVWPAQNVANMGLPPPGAEIKLVPLQDSFEMRVKGPHVTPGYWRQPELTAKAFDEEGYYRLGDAFVPENPRDFSMGLLFAGRIAEDFKLTTGTWVRVGELRARLIEHLAPLVRDAVITGEGRDEVGALLFLAGKASHEELRDRLKTLASTGSSNRIARALVLEEPPSLDAGEMTDKGSINQRAVLKRRAALVDELYSGSERILRA